MVNVTDGADVDVRLVPFKFSLAMETIPFKGLKRITLPLEQGQIFSYLPLDKWSS